MGNEGVGMRLRDGGCGWGMVNEGWSLGMRNGEVE